MRYPNEATYCFVEGADLAALHDPRIGTLLAGRYVIDEIIGEGGMATVYGGRYKMSDRPVAIKIMNPMLATDTVVRERFRREAKSAEKLAHPNIIEIYDQGDTDDGTAYIAMERLHGTSLAEAILKGPIEINRALPIMTQVTRGIARAHDLGVIHRDLKPENIFLCRHEDGGEVVKLLDFGIAKSRYDARLTNQGELFGTPQYMAPERISGGIETQAASDLYSLGVVFYEMLAGELPFNAPDIATFFVKHMTEAPRSLRAKDPRITPELDELVLSLLAKDPKDRPVDAHRVQIDLESMMEHRQLEAIPRTVSERPYEEIALPTSEIDEWAKRCMVLEQMLATAYGQGRAPRELVDTLARVQDIVGDVRALRREGLEAQNALEAIEQKGRESRTMRGHAVDQLGLDLSRAKEDARRHAAALQGAEQATLAVVKQLEETQHAIIFWEGRSALMEPYRELAEAYRSAADATDGWVVAKATEREARRSLERAEQDINDLDFQIRELRGGLARQEQEVDAERARISQRLGDIGKGSAALEDELLDLTGQFTRPLRARPELQTLFKLLEARPGTTAPMHPALAAGS